MYFQTHHFSCRTITTVISVFASVLLILPIFAEAAELPPNVVMRGAGYVQDCSTRSVNDGPAAIQNYASLQAHYFWNDEGALKRFIDAWNTPTCVFDDGRPRLSVMSDAYSQAFKMKRDWNQSLSRIEYLKKKYPKEAFVAVAEARYWIEYAWDARGVGYSSSVANDGWKLFRERMEKVESILLASKSYATSNPNWYIAMIKVQSVLDRPEDERDKVFLEGVKRYPAYYTIYFELTNFLLPKWGGTWRTVDNLVKWSVEHTKAKEGMTMYARLYWVVEGSSDVKLFKDTFASWPKMKQGFADMMARHPKSKWNLNNFAKFACMAGDKQTFLKLRQQIGEDLMDDAWPLNTSIDLCETKFGYME